MLQTINPDTVLSIELIRMFKEETLPDDNFSFLQRFKNLKYFALDNSSSTPVEFDLDKLLYPEKIETLSLDGNLSIQNEKKIQDFKNIDLLNYTPEKSTLKLSSINQLFDKTSFIRIKSSMIDEKIKNKFPNIMSLTTVPGLQNLNYMEDLVNLKVWRTALSEAKPTCSTDKELDTSALNSLKKLTYIFIKDMNINDISFIKNMHYLSVFFPQTSCYDDFKGIGAKCSRDRYDYVESRDISPISDALYLTDYTDVRCGIESVGAIVENCKKGGFFCKNEIPQYNKDIIYNRYLNFSGQLIDINKEKENLDYLSQFIGIGVDGF